MADALDSEYFGCAFCFMPTKTFHYEAPACFECRHHFERAIAIGKCPQCPYFEKCPVQDLCQWCKLLNFVGRGRGWGMNPILAGECLLQLDNDNVLLQMIIQRYLDYQSNLIRNPKLPSILRWAKWEKKDKEWKERHIHLVDKHKATGTTVLLQKELKKLITNPLEGFSVGLFDDDNIYKWRVIVMGPPDSIYETGAFTASLQFPSDFPYSPPTMTFLDPVWHPNIHQDGRVCISVLHTEKISADEREEERWTPIHSVESILMSVISLLSDPNFDSPANFEATAMYADDQNEYKKKVMQCVWNSLSSHEND